MREKFVSYFVAGGMKASEYARIEMSVKKGNVDSVRLLSKIMTLILSVLAISDCFFCRDIKSIVIEACFALLYFLIFMLSRKKFAEKSSVLVYTAIFAGLLYGILNATCHEGTNATAFMGLVLLLPLLFVLRPLVTNVMVVLAAAVMIAVTVLFRSNAIRYYDIMNTLMFSFGSIMASSAIDAIKLKRIAALKENEFLAVHDEMTGLYNRMKYNRFIVENDACKIGACIYFDANGLHEYNNTYGHDAGDEMIYYIATVIRNCFGVENCYRIGGDEFIVFIQTTDKNVVDDLVYKVFERVEQAGFNIAFGYAFGNESVNSLEEQIKLAETRMYVNKKKFYIENSYVRRTAYN